MQKYRVAPFAGAWIEMMRMYTRHRCIVWSLPSRERGLKYYPAAVQTTGCKSLPSRERGLKFRDGLADVCRTDVAPFAGAWIEIPVISQLSRTVVWSLPSRERGLKSSLLRCVCATDAVAPFAGAWIEMLATS